MGYWLGLSRHFFLSFKIKENPSELYFCVNILICDFFGKEFLISEFIDAFKSHMDPKKSLQHTLKTVIYNLIDMEMISVYDLDNNQLKKSKDDPIKNLPYPTRTYKMVTHQECIVRASIYLQNTYSNIEITNESSNETIIYAMKSIFDFMVVKFKKFWECYLEALAASAGDSRSNKHNFDILRESTEYYVILHVMIDRELYDGAHGCDADFLYSTTGIARSIERKDFDNCIYVLSQKMKILTAVPAGDALVYKFSPRAWELTVSYLDGLILKSKELDSLIAEINNWINESGRR